MSSLLPLPVWTVGGRFCPFQRCEPFLCSAPRARTRCWGPLSRPPSGPLRAGPPLALASRDTARECCLQTGSSLSDADFTWCGQFEPFSVIPLSSTSCSWYFLRSATSFLYFSRRSLLASDISLIAAEICNIKRQKKKQNPKTLHHETFWFGQIGKFIKHSSQGTTYLFFCFADSCSIKLWEISNLAPQAGVVCLHRA